MTVKKLSPRILLLQDAAFIAVSIVAAWLLAKSSFFEVILASTKEFELVGSFVAGLFFTSVFTTAPAIVVLGEISQVNGILPTAILGALGAVVGDLIIFRFIKDSLGEHLALLRSAPSPKVCVGRCLNLRMFRWLTFLVGGLIIASPLPDELGVSMLGMSRMRFALFIPLSLVFNFFGILAIGLVASSL